MGQHLIINIKDTCETCSDYFSIITSHIHSFLIPLFFSYTLTLQENRQLAAEKNGRNTRKTAGKIKITGGHDRPQKTAPKAITGGHVRR
jgi:hypothetical protein